MSLIEVISSQSRLNPAKVAVAFGDLSLTYSEFASLTARIAGNLRAAGAEPGDRVAVHLQNGLEASLAYIGCLKAGCVVVPINTRLKGREIDYILRHSGSAFYIGEPELHEPIAASCPAVSMLRSYLTGTSFDDLLRSNSTEPSDIPPDTLAAILYTSGTTAFPKGVIHTHGTLLETARAMRAMALDDGQVVLLMSSMAHMIGFGLLFLSGLLNGATVVVTKPFDFAAALDAFQQQRCTYAFALTGLLRGLLEAQIAAPRDVSSGRFFFGGGDIISASLQHAFTKQFRPICEIYGLTEIAPACWNRPEEVRLGSIGRPAPETTLRILDLDGAEVPPGEVGEIWIRGPHLMRGYWHEPKLRPDSSDGWFRTGDLARCDADGLFWFAGRKKEIIIRGGSNISPQEVEATLCEHPAVAESAVVGCADAIWGETVVAHVALRPGEHLDQAELLAFARMRLADYKVPESVIFHAELPRSPSGKIQRRALREATVPRVFEAQT